MNDLYNETENAKNISKEDVIFYLQNIQKNVEDGNYDEVKSFATIKEIEKSFKSAKESISDIALDRISKDKEVVQDGYQFKVKEGGKQWDFTQIESWNTHKSEINKIEFEAKQNFNNLSKIKTFFDEETGNTINKSDGEVLIIPKVTYRKSSIEITKLK